MLDKPGEITALDKTNLPTMKNMLDKIFKDAGGFRYTNIEPTAKTVHEGEVVVYDDDAGTKRIYVITGQGNLGYVNLT